ncbi:MAG: tetratricopeptide repeat protein [Flavobacteriia bacterium]
MPKISSKTLSIEEQTFIQKQIQTFNRAKSDTSKILALVEIIDNSYNMEVWPLYNDFLIKYIKQIDTLKSSKKTKKFLQKNYADCINNKGFLYGEKGDIKKQQEFYHKSLLIRQKIQDKEGIANSYNNLGYVFDKQGNIGLALEYYLKSLKIKEEIKDSIGIGNTLVNLGFNYEKLNNFSNALKFYQRSLKIRLKIKDYYGIANSYNLIASVKQKEANLLKTGSDRENILLDCYVLLQKALDINKQIDDKTGIAESYNNIGSYFLQINKLDKALSYYQKSNKIQLEIGDKKGNSQTKNNIGNIYLLNGDLKNAEKYALESFQLAKEIGFPTEMNEAAKLLYLIYKKKNVVEKALFYHEYHIFMRDSINNQDIARKNLELNINYDYEKKKATDSIKAFQEKQIKDAQINEQKAKLNQQQTQNIALITGLSMLIIFSFLLFKRFKLSQQQNVIIKNQKEEVEVKNALIEEQHFLLEEKSKEITDSIKYAERIQGAILPPDQKWNYILPNSFVLNKPKDILSGDFYWIAETESHIFVAAADCTGHGVPGALISIVNFNLLNKAVLERALESPAEILDAVNVWLTESLNQTDSESQIKDGMDISLISINKANGQILYSGANNPLYLFSGNELLETKADKFPVGAFVNEEIRSFSNKEVITKFGDTLYLFSDGFADQFGGEKGKKYKYSQFKEALFKAKELPISKQKEFLYQEYRTWRGKYDQTDDILIIGIKF